MNHYSEIWVDNFAGGGGASVGIENGGERIVDIAINHDPEALAMHEANHPETKHYCQDVWSIDPVEVTQGKPVGLAWFSPDCKHFSKAKGGKPVEKKIRDLAWVIIKWAAKVHPRVIMLENVEEFQDWGPLDENNKPIKEMKGVIFQKWKSQLENLGYVVEHNILRACDYGAPTIRKRLFIIARRDGQPIVWPKPTHGPGLIPYKTAADCIDWSLPCPSIFLSKEEGRLAGVKRPLADATLRRIAKGVMRYVVECEDPYIVPDGFLINTRNGERKGQEPRTRSVDEPYWTVTSQGSQGALVQTQLAPFVTEHANASNQRNIPADEPLRTICAQVKGGHFALVTAFLAKHYTGVVGADVREPMPTVTSIDHNAVVSSHLVKLRNGNVGQPVTEPIHTITSGGTHFGEVRAFLVKYYGNEKEGVSIQEPLHTIPTRDRFGLVLVKGEPYQIVDIGMRMLTPKELFKAQGFPEDYILDPEVNGKPLTKTAQTRMCGNSVSPPVAKALVDANLDRKAFQFNMNFSFGEQA